MCSCKALCSALVIFKVFNSIVMHCNNTIKFCDSSNNCTKVLHNIMSSNFLVSFYSIVCNEIAFFKACKNTAQHNNITMFRVDSSHFREAIHAYIEKFLIYHAIQL